MGLLTNSLLISVGEERKGYPDSQRMLPGLEGNFLAFRITEKSQLVHLILMYQGEYIYLTASLCG